MKPASSLNRADVSPQALIDRLQYHLIPGKCPHGFKQIELHNRAFSYWKQFWNNVFAEISPGETVSESDFYRQDVVGILLDGDKIVSLHLYCFFNIESQAALSLGYFKNNYSLADIEKMKGRGVHSVMSMEYLTLDPNYRKSVVGFPVAELIIGLGFEVLRMSGQEAMIAPCRRDLKVDKMASLFGAVALGEEFIHHGVPVVNVINTRAQLCTHPDSFLSQSIQKIWKSKISHLDAPEEQREIPRAA